MRTITFLLLIFTLFHVSVFANPEKYAVDDPSGVWIVNLDPDTGDTIEGELSKMGKSGAVYKFIPGGLPSKSERKYWSIQGNKIVVDTVKKQADLDAKTAKEAEKDAVLVKLKISATELDALLNEKV